MTGNLESGAMADQPKRTKKKGATKRSAKAPASSTNGSRNGAKASKPKAAASKPRRKAPRAKGLESLDPTTGELTASVCFRKRETPLAPVEKLIAKDFTGIIVINFLKDFSIQIEARFRILLFAE